MNRGPYWSVGRIQARRGAGLGNEIFPWAKAYLGSRVFGATLVDPPWRANPRRYDLDFAKGGWASALKYYSLASGPSLRITTSMVKETGRLDYYDALTDIKSETLSRKSRIIVHESGMDLGYRGIRRARPFLQNRLLGTPLALRCVSEMDGRSVQKIRVGLHLRSGDFAVASVLRPGQFNTSMHSQWYVDRLHSLIDLIGPDLELYIAGDQKMYESVSAAIENRVVPRRLRGSSIEDLTALVQCDLILPSISSFSMLALFLSDAAYTWPTEHLNESNGYASIWGNEKPPRLGGSLTSEVRRIDDMSVFRHADVQGRVLLPSLSGAWPDDTKATLVHRVLQRTSAFDLLYHGSVRSGRS